MSIRSSCRGGPARQANPIEDGLYTRGEFTNYTSNGAQADAPDVIRGSTNDDSIFGGGGNDGLEGDDGQDLIDGGDGDDALFGGWGSDTLLGGDGNDVIFGSAVGNLWHPRHEDFEQVAIPAGNVIDAGAGDDSSANCNEWRVAA